MFSLRLILFTSLCLFFVGTNVKGENFASDIFSAVGGVVDSTSEGLLTLEKKLIQKPLTVLRHIATAILHIIKDGITQFVSFMHFVIKTIRSLAKFSPFGIFVSNAAKLVETVIDAYEPPTLKLLDTFIAATKEMKE